ncbi:MAG: non-ribosomal peptide synthetase, partial [Lachnospiraceae bacterium]|nr:non-ribosomal peptide synthetase [Lachnospiraceae bacterium]
MIEFLNIYNNKVRTIGKKVAFDDAENSLTYEQLDECSAKIYNYLKSKGIGREDFVQVLLRRGVKIPAVIMGVVKAGAAFMVLEDTYPADRIDYIYKDLGCKLCIDDKLYDEIMDTVEPLSGCEDMDEHDACYAVYTSGSTGNPKGVLHEYGNIEQGYNSFETWYDEDINNAAIFAPFYFVAGIIDIFHYITRGRTTYIVPHDMVRDFVAVKKFIEKNNIEEIFLPPSYLKIYPNPSKTIKVLYTGSEPANGLSYYNEPTLINFYAMSESGFVVLQSNLSKPYDVAPVGVPLLDEIKACILDEDGKVIEGPGQGELCFINDYVRGYINLPEQTAKTWRNGLYHTNDCVRRDEEGNYYVIGRYDDMIKINGNRVEPVEIETQLKKLTGLKQVIAKGFKIDNRTFICAYYLKDEATKTGIYKNGELSVKLDTLSEKLPDYMIPTYYVALDEFPLLPNGKIAKKNLVPPDIDKDEREYAEPTNETEKIICDTFAKVLKTDRIGITDDFYAMGGDSMSSIVLAAAFSEMRMYIDTKAIYKYRTPGELALYYDKNKDSLKPKTERYDNSKAFEVPNDSGKPFLSQAKAGAGGTFKYHMVSKVDSEALDKAYEKVVSNYPFYNLTFEERDGNIYYKELGYVPKARPIEEIDTTDHTNKPLIEIYYQDNTIIICYYHVLTDGEGFFFFANTFLHEYVNIMHNIEEEDIIRDFDYTYDCLDKRIPVQGDYNMYELPDTFTPPEFDVNNIELRAWKIRLDRKDWVKIVDNFISDFGLEGIKKLQGIGGADAFVAGYMFMKAFAVVHPDAKKPLMCRFPINMRYALGKEDTLRNCALPQAFYNVTARELSDDAVTKELSDGAATKGLNEDEAARELSDENMAMESAYRRVFEQTSVDNVEKEINRLIDYKENPNLDISKDPVYSYIREATVLATNLGNIASNRDAEYVRDFSISFRPTCASSIQSCVMGNKQVLIINQL